MRKADNEARKNFFELTEKVKKSSFPVNITVKGIPKAVLMSREEYEGWMATIETLSDPELMEMLKESEKNIAQGKVKTLEQVGKELGYSEESLLHDKGKAKYVSGNPRKQSRKRAKKA
ncbi:MAG: type II toxin-antitoxin system Phd/YefM family antitoxin [Patescibacteria group bacterium]